MASDQTTLVPSFIIHLNGRRLEMEEEFSVQSVTVTERLNDIATATVVFSDPELQLQKKEEFTVGSEVTVTMGYKDDVKTLFKGDIVSENITLKRDRPPAYTIKGANKLHKIRKHISQAIFYEMTESQVIQKIMDNNGISVVSDDFGREHPIYASSCLSDYDLLKKITDFHGYDFYMRDSTLYLEKHSSRTGSDVILEWGKSLVDCAFKEEVTGQMSRSIVSSWDLYNAQDYASEVDNSTIKAEGPEWAEEFGAAGINMVRENNLISTDETEKRAETILVQRARQFQKISGSCEGNTAIVAGSVVELKEIGNRISKEYLVNAVSHILEADKGYRTVFRLVSNVGAPDGKPVGMTKGTTAEETEEQDASMLASNKSENSVFLSSNNDTESSSKDSLANNEEVEVKDIPENWPENFPIWPVFGQGEEITSSYGYRTDPVTHEENRFHGGIDIDGEIGDQILAVLDGTVRQADFDEIYGYYVELVHEEGYMTKYGHLKEKPIVRRGSFVKKGTVIGLMGSTGKSTGSHLHFEYRINGITKNPFESLYSHGSLVLGRD